MEEELEKLRFEVENTDEISVGAFLKMQGVSRRLVTRLKRMENGIICNGENIRTIDTIKNGDIIELCDYDENFLEPNPSLDVDIAYESDSVIVFDKPYAMPVHPSHGHQGDTLGNFFASVCPDRTFRAINRLDRDTSGLCAVAKNAYAAAAIAPKKVYYAVVCGVIEENGTIDAPIAREYDSIIKRCVRADGQQSVTHYKRIAVNEKYSLAEIHLETGRTHQIRVHFSYIGHPLAGDEMYGGLSADIGRQALHCGQLSFYEPVLKKDIIVKSGLTKDMKKLMNYDE